MIVCMEIGFTVVWQVGWGHGDGKMVVAILQAYLCCCSLALFAYDVMRSVSP